MKFELQLYDTDVADLTISYFVRKYKKFKETITRGLLITQCVLDI